MPTNPEEMRLRDVAIGLRAELVEANHRREKTELLNAQLRNEIQDLNDGLRMAEKALRASQQLAEKVLHNISLRDAEIAAIRKSSTWRIGSLVLAPVHWVKRSKS
jgi:septal ring factor EnvC (AmiA/AmiB activator)